MTYRFMAINAQIAKLDGDERVTFVDLGDAFLADDGALLTELMPDLLHPNERGYDVWAEACCLGAVADLGELGIRAGLIDDSRQRQLNAAGNRQGPCSLGAREASV